MTAQKREAGKNYIGLLHEETGERRATEMAAATNYPVLDILGLVAAMFRRRGEAR
jgi:hypothetical protein